jgi:hypothetical protein
MDKQEVQETLHSMKLLQEAARMLQDRFITEGRSEDQFKLSCSIREYLGALVFCLHRNLLGSQNEDQVHDLCAMLDESLSLLNATDG